MKYTNLDDLLSKNKCPKDKKHTHTRIPDTKDPKKSGIWGGSYYLEEGLMEEFWHHYHDKVFVKKKYEYLTEKQLDKDSILAIDLDFRYDVNTEERQHTVEHITDAIGELALLLNNHLIIKPGEKFEVNVFEKPNLNSLDDVCKDGIHVIVKINVPVEFKMLLWEEFWQKLSVIWSDLPITNSWESVLDKGVFEGGTNWQVFGSRKPFHEAYQLKYIYELECGEDDFEIEEKPVDGVDYKKMLAEISVRSKSKKFKICEKTKELMKTIKLKKRKKKKRAKFKFKNTKISEITTIEQIENECTKLLKQKHKDDLDFEEIHNYTMILNKKYYDNYENWIKVGWALKTVNNDLFWSWILFSAKSEGFNFDDIEQFQQKWKEEFDENGGLTCGSIRFWAKESNLEEFKKIQEDSIQTHIKATLSNYTDYDIAKVLYLYFREEFILASHEKKKWYRFRQNRWVKSEKGSALRLELSKTVSKIYLNNEIATVDKVISGYDDKEQLTYQSMASKYADIGLKLRRTPQKNNIMVEAADLFYDETFLEKLDSNEHLICFKNGVIDIKNKIFRDGAGSDYISMCTNINYVKFDTSNRKHTKIMDEIEDFMKKLFPDKSLRGYMWEHMASFLIGNNDNQTFHFYLGVGSNGKSLFVELLEKCLGDYKASAPLTMITGGRIQEGKATPEIVSLKGKRFAVLQEARKSTVLNEGTFKEYTGCDSITGRPLYGSNMITFKPQFKMVLCTNYLLEIKSTDNGTWRRVRVVDFESRFEDNPKSVEFEHLKNVYKKDKDLKKRFDEWAPLLMSKLVDIVFKTNGRVTDVDKVLAASKNYRDRQDYFSKFMKDKLELDINACTQKRDVNEEFRTWFLNNEGKDVPKGKELFDFLEKRFGKYNKRFGWKGFKIVYENAEDSDNES